MIAIIKQESKDIHPLARFVTVEAVALLLRIEANSIKEIRLWGHMILVVANNLSRFVSYADFPPILGVNPPQTKDFTIWRKRWRTLKTNFAPDFWLLFYSHKFGYSNSLAELRTWGELIASFKFALSQTGLQTLRILYAEERDYWVQEVKS